MLEGCRICGHPDRIAIEAKMRAGFNPRFLAELYQVAKESLYRHRICLGLDEPPPPSPKSFEVEAREEFTERTKSNAETAAREAALLRRLAEDRPDLLMHVKEGKLSAKAAAELAAEDERQGDDLLAEMAALIESCQAEPPRAAEQSAEPRLKFLANSDNASVLKVGEDASVKVVEGASVLVTGTSVLVTKFDFSFLGEKQSLWADRKYRLRCLAIRDDGQRCEAFAVYNCPAQCCASHRRRTRHKMEEMTDELRRQQRRGNAPRCQCGAYRFPHRKGYADCRAA